MTEPFCFIINNNNKATLSHNNFKLQLEIILFKKIYTIQKNKLINTYNDNFKLQLEIILFKKIYIIQKNKLINTYNDNYYYFNQIIYSLLFLNLYIFSLLCFYSLYIIIKV